MSGDTCLGNQQDIYHVKEDNTAFIEFSKTIIFLFVSYSRGVLLWLQITTDRNECGFGPPGLPGYPGRDGRDGRDGQSVQGPKGDMGQPGNMETMSKTRITWQGIV